MGTVIQFPGNKKAEEPANSIHELSFEEGEIRMAVLWPLDGSEVALLIFMAKDVDVALAAIRGDHDAFMILAEMNGYELA